MAKTAGLVLAAIVLGVVMLNIIDDGSTKTGAGTTPTTPRSTTSTTKPAGNHPTTSTTRLTTGAKLKTPAQIRLIVFNAQSGVNGAASNMAAALKNKGYVNQGQPGNANGRTGNAVACRAGLSREAQALATAVSSHTVVVTFPASPPSGVDSAVQCIVLIGKP